MFDEVLVRPLTENGVRKAAPIAPGIPFSSSADVIVLDYGNPESLEIIRQRRDEIAAVLVEPVQGRRLELQPREFMLDLRRVTEELDIALLFDEVVTGFRVHPGGAQAYFGVRADLATYGKIVGGGLPIGVLGGSARFMDALDGGQWQFGDASFPEVGVTYFAGTFVRHPLAIAAAKAVLEYLKAEGPSLQQRVTALTTDAADRVRALADRYGVPLAITNFSGQMQVNPLPAFRNGGLLYILLRLNGIHIYENRGFIFTTAHTTAHVDQLVAAFETTFRQLVAGGFLPEPSIGAPAGSDGGTVLALTEPQREMCAAALMGDEANCSYNQCFALTLDGPLDAGIMRDALADVVRRHEALRLSIDLETESQRVLTAVPVALPVVTLDREEAARKAALDRIIDRETRTPFDLSKAPLWRAELVRESATRHVLVFTAHHVVVDGWSSAVIFSDLAASYIAHRKGVAPALPPAASYRGFVAALESPAVVSESEAALDYWATQYATGVPSFELPLDHARPPLKSYTAGRHVLALDDALLAAVRAFAARQGCTPFVALLAVFEVLVARLTGADDLTLGIPMASQTFEENGHLVAHGVNTIPLRGHVDLAGTFSDHLLATRRSFLDAQAHWRLTFGTLVQKLRLPRDPSRTPLVSITFNVDKLGSPFDFGDLSIAEVSSPKAFFNFDLGINAIIDGDRLVIECDYNADLFDADTIESWMTYYRELLRSAAANPAARIADISLLSDAGRTSLRDEATAAGPRTSSAAATLLELVEAEAQRAPDRIAVECDGRTMSYGTLWSESATIARTLLAGGLARGERVGLCMPRGLALPAALLGILRAGGAYVPLDRSFPDRRLQHIVERAGLRYIVIAARDELPGAVVRSGAAFVDVDALDAARADATPLPEIGGDDLAYVLFTSGSTGQPKGVRVLHRNLGNFLASMREAPGIGRDDVLCAVTTLSFDIAGLEMYLPLVAGARIRIASDDESIDPQLLARALRESRATMLQTTPTLLRMLVDAGEIESLRGVRLLAGGEMLPRDLAGTVLGTCRELWNMYGPTETTIWSTLHRVASVDGRASTLPLGRPIANTWIHIVDASGQPVPRGVHGEIWIGGDGVADGYLDDATRTAERFGDDPFVPGQRMYRTGDVGSLKDGLLYFHGRADDQIKLRGFRIELGDIEAVAFEEPDVREAAAAVRDLGGDDKRLVLYVTARRADPVLADRLTERLRDALPPYMRPNHIAVIETMPHTPNGKVDRRALPAPEIAVSTKEHVAPRSPNEALVVGAFNAALGRTDVGVFDDFFDLGGHSLMAARVMANLSAAAKVALPLRNLFERPTPAQLAAAIDALGWASAPAEAARVTEGREEIEL
jgi:amino acid adenylation domain-containing protein